MTVASVTSAPSATRQAPIGWNGVAHQFETVRRIPQSEIRNLATIANWARARARIADTALDTVSLPYTRLTGLTHIAVYTLSNVPPSIRDWLEKIKLTVLVDRTDT